MYELLMTDASTDWLESLGKRERGYWLSRLDRVEQGNFGDHKDVGGGVIELREIKKGPGYRVYITKQGKQVIVVLVGGDKSTQKKDIARAKDMVQQLK
jgi:putative addiction module killer protein